MDSLYYYDCKEIREERKKAPVPSRFHTAGVLIRPTRLILPAADPLAGQTEVPTR